MRISQAIIGTVGVLCILPLSSLFAEESQENTCEYLGRFEQCVVANQNGNPLSIKEFECPPTRDRSRILDQVILSTEFQKIDKEVLLFLDDLRNNKERIVNEPNAVIDDFWYYLGREAYFYKQYKEICQGGLLAERLSCTEEIPNVVGALYLDGGNYDSRPCMTVVETKTMADLFVAKKFLPISKSEVQNDTKQLFRQEERTRYDALLDLMRDILGFVERLANGITHWTTDPL